MIVPMIGYGEVVGTLGVIRVASDEPYSTKRCSRSRRSPIEPRSPSPSTGARPTGSPPRTSRRSSCMSTVSCSRNPMAGSSHKSGRVRDPSTLGARHLSRRTRPFGRRQRARTRRHRRRAETGRARTELTMTVTGRSSLPTCRRPYSRTKPATYERVSHFAT